MTYSIHRKHNSIFPFFKIHIIKSIFSFFVFPTTNLTAIGRPMTPMDSYVRPLIYKDTQGSCSLPIESNAYEQLKALNCPQAFFMWILHMTYSIHCEHNSYFPFFKIHFIKSILVSSCSQLPIRPPSEGIFHIDINLWYRRQGIKLHKGRSSHQDSHPKATGRGHA